jgi:hypothetical protein
VLYTTATCRPHMKERGITSRLQQIFPPSNLSLASNMAFRMLPAASTVRLQCPGDTGTSYEGMDAPTAMCRYSTLKLSFLSAALRAVLLRRGCMLISPSSLTLPALHITSSSNCFKKRRDHLSPPATVVEPEKTPAQAPRPQAATSGATSVKAEFVKQAETNTQHSAGAKVAAAAVKRLGDAGGSSGFSAGLKPSNDNARVVSGKFAPDAIFRPSSGSFSQFTDVEFFYLDTGGSQIGPAPLQELHAKFKCGDITTDSLFWHDGMNGWEPLGGNAELMRHISPTKLMPPSPIALPPGPLCACPLLMLPTFASLLPTPLFPFLSPTSRTRRASTSRLEAPVRLVISGPSTADPTQSPATSFTLAEPPALAVLASPPSTSFSGRTDIPKPASLSHAPASSMAPNPKIQASPVNAALPASSSKPRPQPSKSDAWAEKRTADLVPYYYNPRSGALQWERPAELSVPGGAESGGSSGGGLVWVPDEVEGFIVARSIGGKNFQTLEGKTVAFSVPKGGSLKPANQASLSVLQDDLVLLEDMSEGMILHNLRERYFKDQIYCGVGSILIAINPFKKLPLYTPDIVQKYNMHSCFTCTSKF